mmetsp:Transcript_7290/g.20715  ORF Transcript_7290/g.20715 Transcript_7290/m.20715 type:complete len:244 (+) Transcript_7290:315-1046(+)
MSRFCVPAMKATLSGLEMPSMSQSFSSSSSGAARPQMAASALTTVYESSTAMPYTHPHLFSGRRTWFGPPASNSGSASSMPLATLDMATYRVPRPSNVTPSILSHSLVAPSMAPTRRGSSLEAGTSIPGFTLRHSWPPSCPWPARAWIPVNPSGQAPSGVGAAVSKRSENLESRNGRTSSVLALPSEIHSTLKLPPSSAESCVNLDANSSPELRSPGVSALNMSSILFTPSSVMYAVLLSGMT